MRIKDKYYWILLGCFIWFLFLWGLFGGSIPYLDSGIDFLQAHDFYSGGVQLLGLYWASLHPPLKMAVVSMFFFLFGTTSPVYALFGFVVACISSSAYFMIVRKSTKSVWVIASMMIIFVLYPMGVAGMIGGFTDYALFAWCLLAWAGYVTKRTYLVVIASLCAVLTKEPGILLPASLIIAYCLYALSTKSKIQWKFIFSIGVTTVGLFVWLGILSLYGKGAWSDHILATGYSSNGIIAALQNIYSGGWNNPYAFQNMLHLFVMNFHWVYWTMAVVGILAWGISQLLHQRPNADPQREALLPAGIFALLYSVLVLSFPTYAIPRYVLPVSASLFVFLLYAMNGFWHIHKAVYACCWGTLVIVSAIGLSRSSDPISLGIWKTMNIDNQGIYNMRDQYAGNDGITYNMQEAWIQKTRTSLIKAAMLFSSDCYQWKLYDPNNDKRIFTILHIPVQQKRIDCLR